MPVITLCISPQQTEKKHELIRGLTNTASVITGIPEDKFVVFIEEYSTDAIGVGGVPLARLMGK